MEYKGTVQVKTEDGHVRNVAILDKVRLPPYIKGLTDKVSFIAINKHLKDLKGKVKKPKLYVMIHELGHVIHPEYNEQENREWSDKIYNHITKENASTANYFKYAEKASRF